MAAALESFVHSGERDLDRVDPKKEEAYSVVLTVRPSEELEV